MKSIEEIKIEWTLKALAGKLYNFGFDAFKNLPANDDLRTFMCSLSPHCANYYAEFVDNCPRDDTRTAACRDPKYAYFYAFYVDKRARPDTREAAYKNPIWKAGYIRDFGE